MRHALPTMAAEDLVAYPRGTWDACEIWAGTGKSVEHALLPPLPQHFDFPV